MSQHKKNQAAKQSILQNSYKPIPDFQSIAVETVYKVRKVREFNASTYVLQFDRNSMDYAPGQHLTVGVTHDSQVREYSIYSYPSQDYLEILVKEVPEGHVSPRLKKCFPGDLLQIDGPFGFFTINEEYLAKKKFLFVATGTGIAPFHSMIGHYQKLDYTLLHGVRDAGEAYEKAFYDNDRHILCTSRKNVGDFHGRVTDYLKNHFIELDTLVYLCGNCDMIYEVYDLLTSRGLPSEQIKTEVYF